MGPGTVWLSFIREKSQIQSLGLWWKKLHGLCPAGKPGPGSASFVPVQFLLWCIWPSEKQGPQMFM